MILPVSDTTIFHMGKRQKQQEIPRYLTIRIQYYPISARVLVIPLIILVLFLVIPFVRLLDKESRITNYESRTRFTRILIPEYKSLLVQATAPVMVGENTVPAEQTGKVIFHGPRERKEIALTFDADMTPGMKSQLESGEVASYYNRHVIDILNQTQTKATLFLAGMWIEIYKQEAKELATNHLFELASHSYSHPAFHKDCYGLPEISDGMNQEEIQKTQDLLHEVTGIKNTLFRFPGGCYSQSDVDSVEKNGLKVIQWDAVGQDGFNHDASAIERNALQHVQNGSIIVLHMHGGPNAPLTADALPKIISTLKDQGYTFVTVSELLGESQTQQAIGFKQLLSYYR